MKKTVLLSSILGAILFTGCYQKGPQIEDKKEVKEEVINYENKIPLAKEKKEIIKPNVIKEEKSGVIDEIMPSNIKVNEETQDAGTSIGLKTIYFNYDSFEIKEDMQEAMTKNFQLLNGQEVKIEGNCDEFGSDEYNSALGLKRANAVKSYLLYNGYDESKISMVTYGESNPVCQEKTDECYSKNRRVEFKLRN